MAMAPSKTLAAALRYLELGQRPIPVRGKVPQVRGWNELDIDEDTVRAWWGPGGPHAGSNVGLVVPTRVIIVDVDDLAALEAIEGEHGPLPETWTAITGRGGRHIWLSTDRALGNSSGRLPDGIDIRGGGKGQVVVWPSVHPDTGQQYRWAEGLEPGKVSIAPAPAWLVELLAKPAPRPASQPRPSRPTNGAHPWVVAGLERECADLAAAVKPGRNQRLNDSVWRFVRFAIGGYIDETTVQQRLLAAGLTSGLDPRKAQATVDSATKGAHKKGPLHPPERDRAPGLTDPAAPTVGCSAGDSAPFKPLERDTDVVLARTIIAEAEAAGPPLVCDEGELYRCADSPPVWQELGRSGAWRHIAQYDGRLAISRYRDDGEPKYKRIVLSAGRIKGVAQLVSMFSERPGFFAGAPHGVGFQNGFVSLDGGKVAVEPLTPEHRCRALLPCNYDPDARAPRWVQFLCEVLRPDADRDNTTKTLQEFFGACLLGLAVRHQRCLILDGVGANGKSVMLEVISALFPQQTRCAIAPQELARDFRVAALAGKRLNVVNEVPDTDVASSERFKAVIDGRDITTERKNRDPFTFAPVAGHVFACNALPGTADTTHGYWRKFLVVPMMRIFEESEQERGLGQRLIEEELPGIAAWVLQGAARLERQGRYSLSETSRQAMEEWKEGADRVLAWVRECCDEVDTGGTAPKPLYDHFRAWCSERGHHGMSIHKFGRRLKVLGYAQTRTAKGRWYPLAIRPGGSEW